jgi:predicted acyl esterase
VDIPVYLGCDWQNVPLHLPSTIPAFRGLINSPQVRVAMLGEHGLAWPWESLHVEALAWFDHWLKGRDTGTLEGPRFRYVLPEAEGWHTAESWPPEGATPRALALRADGLLADDEGDAGSRTLMTLGAGLGRIQASETDPPSHLTWTSATLKHDLNVVGDIELQLDAASTASDTAWIVLLQDVDPVGAVTEITAGYLRAGLRGGG